MAGFPEPEAGLVISYAYLWSEEAERGQVEGLKDRPCAVLLVIQRRAGEHGSPKTVAVAPITHSPPPEPEAAVEIPFRVKQHLGLDSERSWVFLGEVNVFTWPGYDLRPAKDKHGRIDYGFLPPKLFASLIDKFSELNGQAKVRSTSRDDES
jgi:hypothetical protein